MVVGLVSGRRQNLVFWALMIAGLGAEALPLAEVAAVEVGGRSEEGDVDGGKVAGKPALAARCR
jgi:hypothetical protein